MPDTPQTSGADLARQALAAYKAGRRPGTAPAKPTRKAAATRRDGGRDPQTFAAVLGRLGAEQGWASGVQGGSILDRFGELCPQYEGRVQAVGYDPERRVLALRPGSDAYAAQLRLLGGQLARQINDKLGAEAVRAIRVLPVATLDAPTRHQPSTASTAKTEQPAEASAPRVPSSGYQLALAAHREHRGEPVDLTEFTARVAAARARQDAALAVCRLPVEEHAEYLAQLEAQQDQQPATGIEASIQAARLYARTGQVAGGREPQQVFGAA
ncbi:DciA family protein [Streptomyces cinereoruber]|uniref:DciA family protein n=1 Tax=Streptomyces cinereoruber TaxID=67260 RepID=UPI00363BF7F9